MPARIKWRTGKEENIFLAERILVPRFPAIREIMGKNVERKFIEKQLKDKWLGELFLKMEASINRVLELSKINGKDFTNLSF
jgi:hypothetical protein